MTTWTGQTWTLPSDLVEREPGRKPRRTPRDWLVDVTIFLATLGGGALLADTTDKGTPGWLVDVDFATGVACCLMIWLRRRWPMPVMVLTAAAASFSAWAGFAAIAALFTVAVHRRTRDTAIAVAANLVSGAVYSLVRPDATVPLVLGLAIVVLIVGGVVAWGLFVRARRELIISLRERAQRAEGEQTLRVEQARTLERTRIAREMHDVLAHRISLVSLHAGALEFRPDASPQEVAEAAAVIRASAHQALQDLREVIGVLREGTAPAGAEPPQPTLADLPRLLEESREAGMKIVDETTDLSGLPVSTGRAAYRVVQEGLTNARKHAPGVLVTVAVTGSPSGGVDVVVRNRRPLGAAPSVIPGSGQGLVGLRERTDLAGGRLEFSPRGDDVELRAWLPWPA